MAIRYESRLISSSMPKVLAALAIVATGKKIESEVQPTPDIKPKELQLASSDEPEAGYTQLAVASTATKAHYKVHHHLTPAQKAAALVTPYLRYEFNKIHICEGNPWNLTTGNYPGGLGETDVNYVDMNQMYHLHYPNNAGEATIDEQINDDRLLLKTYGMTNLPDQDGCTGSY